MEQTDLILEQLKEERELQNKLWGFQSHHLNKWMVILMEEVGEAASATRNAFPFKNKITLAEQRYHIRMIRQELIQVAAVAVATIESIDKTLWEGEK